MAMRADTVVGVVTGLLLAIVAMALVLALGRSPSPPPDSGRSRAKRGCAATFTDEP